MKSHEASFTGYDWTLVDAVYLQGSTAGYVTQQWREFLERLGVIDFLAVKQDKVTIKHEDMVC